MMDYAAEVERLSEGRTLTPADRAAIDRFAALEVTAERARQEMDAEGITFLDGEIPRPHPAVTIEQKASQELARWVATRPDLFGVQDADAGDEDDKFEGFEGLALA